MSRHDDHDAHTPGRGVRTPVIFATAVSVLVSTVLPMYLVGALAVQLREDLGFGSLGLGVAIGVLVLSRAVSSVALGRAVDRIGAVRTMRIAVIGCALSAAGIALAAHNLATLIVWLVVGGSVQALAAPATSRLLLRSIPSERLGMAFGIQQSGPPLATLLAGLSVPLVALTFGWRWAFGATAVLALSSLLVIPGRARLRVTPPQATTPSKVEGAAIGLLALGMGFVIGGVNSMNAFLVESSVATGISPGNAGLLLTGGGLIAIVLRLFTGARADRRRIYDLRLLIGMQASGALGLFMLATAVPALVIPGAALAFGGTWGGSALLFLSIARNNPTMPGAATGKVVAGSSVGGFLGPPLFGYIVQISGYPMAWTVAGIWVLIGSSVLIKVRARLTATSRG